MSAHSTSAHSLKEGNLVIHNFIVSIECIVSTDRAVCVHTLSVLFSTQFTERMMQIRKCSLLHHGTVLYLIIQLFSIT